MHSARQTNPKPGSCKRTTQPGKEVGGEKWQVRDKASSEESRGGDEHWQSQYIAKSEDMGFGMITSGKALWLRAGKSIMLIFFCLFKSPTIQPPRLLVYSQILFSCIVLL